MHEWGIAKNLVNLVNQKLGSNFKGRIATVNVRIGKLRGVPPYVLRSCFEALAAGSLLEGARLEVKEVEPQARCESCGRAFLPDELLPDGPHYSVRRACPSCGNTGVEIAQGNELFVESIEVED
jgi:hydrogenase nickel incorporation protein HypA/HybF